MSKKVSWHSLTDAEKEIVGNVPGAGVFTGFINWLLTKALGIKFSNFSFSPHDWSYVRGGTLWDKTRSDIQMKLYILVDATEQKNLLKGIAAIIVAPIAFIIVSIFGLFFFDFGPYRTKEEALKIALEKQ